MVNYNNLGLSEVLMYNTVKLICKDKRGEGYYGTGFIFKYFRTEKDSVPVIVSNKHILEDTTDIMLTLHRSNNDNIPIPETRSVITIHLEPDLKYFLHHPDKNIDLSIFPFGKLIEYELYDGRRPYYSGFDQTTIPTEEEWQNLHVFEDVLSIGYPLGMMDEMNNFPIFIKGHTATHPNINYNFTETFLINSNNYSGSSGSPIILLNNNFYEKSRNRDGLYSGVKLLGILYSGFEIKFNGEIIENSIENIYNFDNKISLPTQICKILRSTKLNDFEDDLKKHSDKI